MGSTFQYGDPGQLLALEELEAGAATGGDVPEGALVEAEDAYGGRRVAAPDDRQAVDLRQRLGDGSGALGEGGRLEDAHRPVPEHGPGRGDRLGERPRRLG